MNLAERVAAIGLTPVVACELEFCLIDAERLAETGRPFPPRAIQSGQVAQSQAYDLAVSARLAPLFDAIRDACAAQQLPLKALSCEVAPGQVEINLTHVADPLRAADQAVSAQASGCRGRAAAGATQPALWPSLRRCPRQRVPPPFKSAQCGGGECLLCPERCLALTLC